MEGRGIHSLTLKSLGMVVVGPHETNNDSTLLWVVLIANGGFTSLGWTIGHHHPGKQGTPTLGL